MRHTWTLAPALPALLGLLTATHPRVDRLSATAPACPLTDSTAGFPLAVAWRSSAPADSAYLADFAHAAAYRWRVPSRRRNAYEGWARVHRRLLPPEPRWADDWQPDTKHHAVLAVTLYADGRDPVLRLEQPSGDDRFDRSLESVVREPMPASPTLPELPAAAGDSVTLALHFGSTPSSAPHAVVRFAAEQRPVRLTPGTLRVNAPPGSRGRVHATVKYDVTTGGRVAPGSIEVLESSDPGLSQAILDGLSRAGFAPAQSNCRPIALSVVQTFGR